MGIWRSWRASYPAYSWITLREAWGDGLHIGNRELSFFRHGETTTNQQDRVTGRIDAELTETGVEQARLLGASLKGTYGAAFCSTLRRSELTLRIALVEAKLGMQVFSDDRLCERSLGELEGGPRLNLPELAQGNLDWAPPGGETYREVARRCMSFLVDLAEARDEERILISTHQGPLRVFKAILEGYRDPRELTRSELKNTETMRYSEARVPWPAFLGETYALYA